MHRTARRLASLLALAVVAAACTKDDPAEPHRKKGNVLFKKNEYAAAAAEYDEAVKLAEKPSVKDYETAAFAWTKASDYDKAAERLVKSRELKDDAAGKLETTMSIAGMYLQSANDLDKAEQFFTEAFTLDPKNESALSWLAEIASRRGGARAINAMAVPGQLDVALERYDRLIAMNAAAPAHYINKRIVLMKYIDHLGRAKAASEKDAEANASDKTVQQDFLDQAAKFQARADELKAQLDETTKKLVEVQKAAKK